MAGKTDYVEAEALKWATGQESIFGPADTRYLALFSVAPTDAGGGTEFSGGSYTRERCDGSFTAPTGADPMLTVNSVEFVYNQASADWGDIVAVGIYDELTDGQLLYWAPVNPAITVLENMFVRFAPGAVTVQED